MGGLVSAVGRVGTSLGWEFLIGKGISCLAVVAWCLLPHNLGIEPVYLLARDRTVTRYIYNKDNSYQSSLELILPTNIRVAISPLVASYIRLQLQDRT